jgi:large subunit ribosomal protein L5
MLKEKFTTTVIPALGKKLNITNVNAVPRIEKVVVNAGIGKLKDNKAAVASYIKDFVTITGQAPSKRQANKAISNFKLREGEVIGLTVTLRGDRMWTFLEKLLYTVLPRTRDFEGISTKAFDNAGNYSLGMNDHTVFPEIDTNRVDMIKNLQINVVTSTKNKEESFTLLEELGFPFKKTK